MNQYQTHMSAKKFWIILLGLIVAATYLTGCLTPKKAVDYLKKKDLLNDTCNANFPVLDPWV